MSAERGETSGGKGNKGMFIERDKNVCAAGIRSAQPELTMKDSLKQYLLIDEVNALIGDAIKPPQKPYPLAPLRHPKERDMRNAGPFSDACLLISPPYKTKFQTLVDDFKNTVYSSYWKKEVGTVTDPNPGLPQGFNILSPTFGRKNPDEGRIYDIVMPAKPYPDKTSPSKAPGYKVSRNYNDFFNPNSTFGQKTNVDPRGILVKCVLNDHRTSNGKDKLIPINRMEVDLKEATNPKLGQSSAPNNNISSVPEGFSFGFLKEPSGDQPPIPSCDINPEKFLFLKQLGHLNSVRTNLSKCHEASMFRTLFLELKYHDQCKTGWLPKEVVYKICGAKHIRFNPNLLEPLFAMWNCFNGSEIMYKIYCNILNFREPLPELPKIHDIPSDCLYFKTTYKKMVKPDQVEDLKPPAGVPCGRYLDTDLGYRRGEAIYFIDESNAKACCNPSILSLLGVNHRDIYRRREPEVIRGIVLAMGEELTDESFKDVWEEAAKYHSEGWVCIETFLRALENKRKEKKL